MSAKLSFLVIFYSNFLLATHASKFAAVPPRPKDWAGPRFGDGDVIRDGERATVSQPKEKRPARYLGQGVSLGGCALDGRSEWGEDHCIIRLAVE